MDDDTTLADLLARRDALRETIKKVASGKASRDYGAAEIADIQAEIRRLDVEIARQNKA